MSKKPQTIGSDNIPVLSDIVSSEDDKKREVAPKQQPIRGKPASSHPLDTEANTLSDDLTQEVDITKLEKLIAEKLEKRLKGLSRELATEISAELSTTSQTPGKSPK